MQQNIWRSVNFGVKVSEMVFLRDFEARQACIDEHKTGCLDIHNEEPGDSNDDTQSVTYVGPFPTQERQNLVRDLRLKVESTSMHQFWSKLLASINMNMMVGMVKNVNYNEDNSVCSIEVLQCPQRGATKDSLYVDIC